MARKPGGPRSTALQSSMKRYQRSCATLRASRLLIDLSRIGMARGRALLEQQASKEDRGNNLPHERGAESLGAAEGTGGLRDQQLRRDPKGLVAARGLVRESRERRLRVALEGFEHEGNAEPKQRTSARIEVQTRSYEASGLPRS